MVTLGRFELPTSGLGNRCSIQLSYRATLNALHLRVIRQNSNPLSFFQIVLQWFEANTEWRRMEHDTNRVTFAKLREPEAFHGMRVSAMPLAAREIERHSF
jgi:hypothetical protein